MEVAEEGSLPCLRIHSRIEFESENMGERSAARRIQSLYSSLANRSTTLASHSKKLEGTMQKNQERKEEQKEKSFLLTPHESQG